MRRYNGKLRDRPLPRPGNPRRTGEPPPHGGVAWAILLDFQGDSRQAFERLRGEAGEAMDWYSLVRPDQP